MRRKGKMMVIGELFVNTSDGRCCQLLADWLREAERASNTAKRRYTGRVAAAIESLEKSLAKERRRFEREAELCCDLFPCPEAD